MTDRLQIYKCTVCGIVVEVLDSGSGQMTCCGEPMKRLVEQTADAAKEKHVPVIEKIEGGYKVKVGSVPHPMQPEHFIQWIELLADGCAYRRFLEPTGRRAGGGVQCPGRIRRRKGTLQRPRIVERRVSDVDGQNGKSDQRPDQRRTLFGLSLPCNGGMVPGAGRFTPSRCSTMCSSGAAALS